jgi:hypothetical protein
VGNLTENGVAVMLRTWEAEILNPAGTYIGEDLYEWGFPWRPGAYIPRIRRVVAMRCHRNAITCRRQTVEGVLMDMKELT